MTVLAVYQLHHYRLWLFPPKWSFYDKAFCIHHSSTNDLVSVYTLSLLCFEASFTSISNLPLFYPLSTYMASTFLWLKKGSCCGVMWYIFLSLSSWFEHFVRIYQLKIGILILEVKQCPEAGGYHIMCDRMGFCYLLSCQGNWKGMERYLGGFW
jgi:hypothetical protein